MPVLLRKDLLVLMFATSMALPVLGSKDCGEGSCEPSDDTVLLQVKAEVDQPFSRRPIMDAVYRAERKVEDGLDKLASEVRLGPSQPVSFTPRTSDDRHASKALTEKNIAVQLDEDVRDKEKVAHRALEHDAADALISTHEKELHTAETIKRNAMNRIEAINVKLEQDLETSHQQLKSELADIDRDEFEAIEDARDQTKKLHVRALDQYKKQRKSVEEADTAAHEAIKVDSTKAQERVQEQAAADIAHVTLQENKASLEMTRAGLKKETGILAKQIEHNYKEEAATAKLAHEKELEGAARRVVSSAQDLTLDQMLKVRPHAGANAPIVAGHPAGHSVAVEEAAGHPMADQEESDMAAIDTSSDPQDHDIDTSPDKEDE